MLINIVNTTTEFKEKYINPFTDYGFKRLFGEESNKNLLLDFLNEKRVIFFAKNVIPEKIEITGLTN